MSSRMIIGFGLLVAASLVLLGLIEPVSPPEIDSLTPGLERVAGELVLDGVLFTGRLVESYADGGMREASEYLDGRRHGRSQAWFENGAVWYERSYRDGRKHGEHKGWYADGTVHFEYRFEDGLSQGNHREWYPDGLPYREFNYIDGQESGAQRMWHADGTLRANYVIKDGRRFGLIGSKGCVGAGVALEDAGA